MTIRGLAVALLTALVLTPVLTTTSAQALPDPLRSEQYGIDLIHAPAAWQTATGEGVRVAVIDSGVDHAHLDLVRQIAHTEGESVAEPYGLFADLPVGPWETTQDTDGHGTLVTGVLAAERGNGVGIAGTSDATVIPIKLDDVGVIPYAEFIADGIQAAIEADADVVQISQTTTSSLDVLDTALADAEEAGLVVVAASGNEDEATPRWPAAAGTAVAVGAVDADAEVWSESNAGVALVAPGVEVLSTQLGNLYRPGTGTSFAAPFVSGTVALMLDACPTMPPSDVREALNRTAEDLGPPGYDADAGWGLLRADRAVAAATAACA